MIGLGPWIKKRGKHLSCIEEKGGGEYTAVHKMPPYLLIYFKISFLYYSSVIDYP